MSVRRGTRVTVAGVVLVLSAGCGVRPDPAPVPLPEQDVPNLTSPPTPSATD